MDKLKEETAQEILKELEDISNQSKELATMYSNVENTIALILKQELAMIYTNAFMCNIKAQISIPLFRWYWRLKAKHQRKKMQTFINGLPHEIKHEATSELLEIAAQWEQGAK